MVDINVLTKECKHLEWHNKKYMCCVCLSINPNVRCRCCIVIYVSDTWPEFSIVLYNVLRKPTEHVSWIIWTHLRLNSVPICSIACWAAFTSIDGLEPSGGNSTLSWQGPVSPLKGKCSNHGDTRAGCCCTGLPWMTSFYWGCTTSWCYDTGGLYNVRNNRILHVAKHRDLLVYPLKLHFQEKHVWQDKRIIKMLKKSKAVTHESSGLQNVL